MRKKMKKSKDLDWMFRWPAFLGPPAKPRRVKQRAKQRKPKSPFD
jgi:hypothetical protein